MMGHKQFISATTYTLYMFIIYDVAGKQFRILARRAQLFRNSSQPYHYSCLIGVLAREALKVKSPTETARPIYSRATFPLH